MGNLNLTGQMEAKMEEKGVLIHQAGWKLRLHPNTLRKLERLGVVNPSRSLSGHRLYSEDDIRKVREYYGRKRMGDEEEAK